MRINKLLAAATIAAAGVIGATSPSAFAVGADAHAEPHRVATDRIAVDSGGSTLGPQTAALAGPRLTVVTATPIGDLVLKLKCLALRYIGKSSVDSMDQANENGEAAIAAGDGEAYYDAFNDYVSAHATYSDAHRGYNDNGCGSITGPFPTAPDPIF